MLKSFLIQIRSEVETDFLDNCVGHCFFFFGDMVSAQNVCDDNHDDMLSFTQNLNKIA